MPITFAFQPIVDVETRSVFSYEALVRGAAGESAATVLSRAAAESPYAFDRECRSSALKLAARLGMGTRLNINFLPNAVYDPLFCIQTTLAASRAAGFPLDRIVFEVTEGESVQPAKLLEIFSTYKRLGFKTAIDDFGAGYSGLGLLSQFQPDFVKLDMQLVRDVDAFQAKQAIARSVITLCGELGITLIAEGIETPAEYAWLRDAGVTLFQGYLFAPPALEELPEPAFPAV